MTSDPEQIVCRRMQLPSRLRGAGIRLRSRLAPAAYAASFITASQQFLPSPGRPGFFPQLEDDFGPGAFDEGGHRFASILVSSSPRTCPSVYEFEVAWVGMQRDLTARTGDVRGPLDERSDAAGRHQPDTHLQRRITQQREQVWADELQRDVMLLPQEDERRIAYLSEDRASSEFVRSFPSESHGWYTTSDEFAEILCDYLGVESPVSRQLTGRQIGTTDRRCDAYGHQLCLATLPGGGWTTHHDSLVSTIIRDVRSAGMDAVEEPRGIFVRALPQVTLQTTTDWSGTRVGIVPDASVRARLPASPGADAVRRREAQIERRYLLDFKTVHAGSECYHTRYIARASTGAEARLRSGHGASRWPTERQRPASMQYTTRGAQHQGQSPRCGQGSPLFVASPSAPTESGRLRYTSSYGLPRSSRRSGSGAAWARAHWQRLSATSPRG